MPNFERVGSIMTDRNGGLIVLRTMDVDRLRVFLEAFGLEFQAEKHGDGPEHWSASSGDNVLDLYPAKERT